MKQILKKLGACQDARQWAADKSIEEVINTCHRGDWLLWLAKKLDIDSQKLTLSKGLCANTVRHLMKDERSIKAVDTAIAFGNGEATREELNAAYADAAAAAYDAAYADAAYAAAAYADAAYAAAAYADAYDADADARKQNQLLTANICRDVLGQILIEKLLTFKSE